jgi:hypothetical protein
MESERMTNPDGTLMEGVQFMLDVLEKEFTSLPRPEHRPVVGRVFVSAGGRMIVERLDLDATPFDNTNPAVWDLIDADGRITGRFESPLTFTPRLLTDEHLYATVRDDLDVNYVVRYVIR